MMTLHGILLCEAMKETQARALLSAYPPQAEPTASSCETAAMPDG